MKFFPLKIVLACLILTPLLYIVTLSAVQDHLENKYLQSIQNAVIGDSGPLLNGTVRIEDQMAKNIQDFLSKDSLVKLTAIDLDIRATTTKGKIIYPTYVGADLLDEEIANNFNTEAIAKDNFEILNSGFDITAKLHIEHGSLVANIILGIYSGLSFLIVFLFYRKGLKKAEILNKEQTALINTLKNEEKKHEQMLKEIGQERQDLFENIKDLNHRYQSDLKKAKINEEEMFNEIVSLEEKLKSFIESKKTKEQEIDELKSMLQKYEKQEERRKSTKGRRNEYDFLVKRFSALYKNVEMERKALIGFQGLNEDQQIKAEEVVFQLNNEPEKVIIKRKVFSGKKHKTACFEVLFAYNGRLYFRNAETSTQIVVIGTKNSQNKDMEYLHSL